MDIDNSKPLRFIATTYYSSCPVSPLTLGLVTFPSKYTRFDLSVEHNGKMYEVSVSYPDNRCTAPCDL